MGENLLKKSSENYKTAEWARKQKFLDVATSRYYYSLYEKIIYISQKEGFYEKPSKGEDSHIFTIQKFQQEVFEKLNDDEISDLAAMSDLKKARVDADYSRDKMEDNNKFTLSIMTKVSCINSLLDKLLSD